MPHSRLERSERNITMLNSIATVSLSGTLREKLEAIAEAGFRAAEIFENDFLASDLSAQDVHLLMSDLGLANVVYQPFRDFEGLSGLDRIRAFDRAEKKFDLMQQIGTDLLLICSTTIRDSSADPQRIADDFRELGERAGKRQLRIAYEALAWGQHINDHRQVVDIVRQVDLPSVGLVLDSFHSLSRDIPVSSIDDIDPEKIFLVQMADAPLMKMDLLQWSRHYRCMPLQGGLAVTEWVAALMRIGYKGPLSLEIFNDSFRAGFAKIIAEDGHRSLVAVRGEASQLLDQKTRIVGRPDVKLEFVEFAAAPETEPVLEKMLRGLGLKRVGRHRTRAVQLWQGAGKARIIINNDGASLAGSFSLMHGQGVCAIGVRVPDRKAAASRAVTLGIATHHETADSLNQLDIPALRAIGGSLIYLLDDETEEHLWEREFIIESASPAQVKGGIYDFDHLSSVVRPDEFLSWVLYWTTAFKLDACPVVDVIDPGGMVQSRAIENRTGALRITLGAAQGQHTLASRFERNFFGSGYQHLALATDDIFEAAERMKRASLPVLEIGQNYYDDLQARFGITKELADRLAASNILYDREPNGGEFFQIFSRAIDRTFFFEIVQRVGTYGGYGAPNTAIRLTAQRRAGAVPEAL